MGGKRNMKVNISATISLEAALHLEEVENKSAYIDELIKKNRKLNSEQTISDQKIDVSKQSMKQINAVARQHGKTISLKDIQSEQE